MSNDNYIGPVRPLFKIEGELPKNKRVERLIAGSEASGMVIDVTRKGLEINAYYLGFDKPTKYSVLREPVVIPWEEVAKIKGRIEKPKSKNKKTLLDRVEGKVDMKHLKTLPIVTINGRKYYIDPAKRERRAVQRPEEVWKF